MKVKDKQYHRKKIKQHIRKTVEGTTDCPRLSVYRSLKHIYAQIIDDSTGKTLVAVSSLTKEVRESLKEGMRPKEISKQVGIASAKKALEKNIHQVVFDRNGFRYHGCVQALAEGAREGGLKL
ncbi:MAG: 50S ribosomal protein L18 [Bacteroidota bacterium]